MLNRPASGNSPDPDAPGLAAAEALHLRFAITPSGHAIQHLADGPQSLMNQQQDSARHELNLAALLVCLMADEAEFGAGLEPPEPGLAASPPAETAWLMPGTPDRHSPEPPPPLPGAEAGAIADDGWARFLHGRPSLDLAWPLA